tara:strand:+ start:1496 stop:4723 length:3228 start_codon:yes stop_codon:yes gene_type:complete
MANTKIPSELIADSAITATHLSDGTISPADIAVNAITTAKIADSNITTAKLNDDAVTTAKITDANVTTAKIADDAVTTAKMADNSVTSDTIASGITLAGTTTLTSHLVMGDNDYIKLGDSSDFLLTHDGSNSYIIDNGTGNLVVAANAIYLKNAAYNEQMISAIENGAVELYYDNSKKLETVTGGVTVTGTLTATALAGNLTSGNIAISSNTISNATSSMILDSAGDIILDADGGDIRFKDGGTEIGVFENSSSDFQIKASVQDKDIIFRGNDGGSGVNALVLDMSAGGAATFSSDLTIPSKIMHSGDVDNYFRFSDTDTQSFVTGNSTRLQITNSLVRLNQENNNQDFAVYSTGSDYMLYVDASTDRVGIGTSSPSAPLHVVGNSYVQNGTLFTDAITAYSGSSISINAGSSHLAATVNGSERVRITSAGKVGIGNTAPLGKLTISNAAGQNAPTSITAANTYLQLGSDDFGPDGSTGHFMIGFGYTDATNTHSPAYIGFQETSTAGDTKGELIFLTRDVVTDSAPTERMRIDDGGKVGIATSTNHAGSAMGYMLTIDSAGGSGSILEAHRTGNSRFELYQNATGGQYLDALGTTAFMALATGGTERMRIDSSGKVIIGDTASHVDDLFQIETPASGGGHGIQIRRNDSNNDQGIGRIMFGNNTDTDLATISAITDGATDNARLVFSTQPTGGSSTERMRITGGAATSSDADVVRTASSVGIRSTHYTPFEFNGMGGHGSEVNANIKKALKEACFGSYNVNFDVGSYSNGLYYVGAGKGASTTNSYIKFKVSLSKATTMALNHECGNSADGTTRTMNIDYSFDDLNWTNAATGTFGAGSLDQSATLNFSTIGQMSIGGVFSGDIYIRFEFKGGSSGHDTLIGWRRLKLEAEAEDMQLVNPGGPGYGPVECAMFRLDNSSAITTNNSGFLDLRQHAAGGYMNPNIFEIDTTGNYGIHIKRDGKVWVDMNQDIITTGATSYATSRIYRSPANDANNSVMAYQLITNTNSQWNSIHNSACFDVTAGDRIQFYLLATNITNLDTGSWSQYNIMWMDSQHSGEANRMVTTHQENAHFNF